MSKISQYAQNTSPALTDYLIGVQASGPTTKRFVLSDLVTLFLNNIPATEGSLPFVSSGLLWTADAAGSTRAATMSAGRIRVNTNFLAISAVTSRVFTASKDTYVDILDNLDGTGTVVYTEVTNNAASPALASNSTRIAIIITGASNIANSGSINQGEETKVLPIASSQPYATTDSLGNLINPRDALHQIIGLRQIISSFTTSTFGSFVDVTGLLMPIIAPGNRKVLLTAYSYTMSASSANPNLQFAIQESTTELTEASSIQPAANFGTFRNAEMPTTPSAGLHTYKATVAQNGAATLTLGAASVAPAFIMAQLK